MDKIFSKSFNRIKVVCDLEEDKSHDIKTLYEGNGMYYAYYKYSGLRAITKSLFCELKSKFEKKM